MSQKIDRIAEKAFLKATADGHASVNATFFVASAILKRAAKECEWIADQARERQESQAIELGALRCRDAICALAKEALDG